MASVCQEDLDHYCSGGESSTVLPEKATDRAEEIAQFLHKMKIKQEQNGVCDETTTSENGRHQCPILW